MIRFSSVKIIKVFGLDVADRAWQPHDALLRSGSTFHVRQSQFFLGLSFVSGDY